MISSLQLVIRNEISFIRRRKVGLPDDWDGQSHAMKKSCNNQIQKGRVIRLLSLSYFSFQLIQGSRGRQFNFHFRNISGKIIDRVLSSCLTYFGKTIVLRRASEESLVFLFPNFHPRLRKTLYYLWSIKYYKLIININTSVNKNHVGVDENLKKKTTKKRLFHYRALNNRLTKIYFKNIFLFWTLYRQGIWYMNWKMEIQNANIQAPLDIKRLTTRYIL